MDAVTDDNGRGAAASGPARPEDRRSRRPRSAEQVRRDAARLLDAVPPQALEAEIGLLGALLVEWRVIGDVIGVLKGPDDFASGAHATIYQQMVELYERDNAFDIVKLNQRLVDRGLLEAIGGLDYLVELAQSVPSATFAVEYARIVREKSVVRSLIRAAGEILVDAHEGGLAAKELLQQAESRIFAIAQQSEQASTESLSDLVEEALRQIDSNEGRHVTGLSTGYYDLDEYTSGLQQGELIVLAARPSMGKTALAINLAENIATAGHAVAVFSLEMSRQQLVQRLICARSGVDSHRFRRGMLGKDEYRRILSACGDLAQAPIYIDDTPGLTLLQMRSKARRLAERHGIRCVVIDYLQLMSTGGRTESRQVEVSEMSRGVKAMARELRVPVVCLSQLNRAAEQREGHRPRMSDLRESGSIEQDADVVMMLHREDYYHQSDAKWLATNPDKIGVAELILAKQRNGPTGTVELQWNNATTRFNNRDHRRPGQTSGHAGEGARPGGPRTAFHATRSTGPVDDFRDGGGPELAELPD